MLQQAWDIIRYADLQLSSASLMINRMLESGWQLPRKHVHVGFLSVGQTIRQERTKQEKLFSCKML